jgi:hypothetical protein
MENPCFINDIYPLLDDDSSSNALLNNYRIKNIQNSVHDSLLQSSEKKDDKCFYRYFYILTIGGVLFLVGTIVGLVFVFLF